MKEWKLTFESVPEECWGYSLYHILTPADWDKVRKDAYRRAGYKCRICGAKGRLEAHEKWNYDEENRLQKLTDVLALCNKCHSVKHISRAYAVGKGEEAAAHFMAVNGCSQMEFHEALGQMNEEYRARNQIQGWVTDITWLKDKFEIVLK